MAVKEATREAKRSSAPDRRPTTEGTGNELALVAVTAVLKSLLENGMVDRSVAAHAGSDCTVTAQSTDRVRTGEEEKPQLNLFMYQAFARGLRPRSRYGDGATGDGEGRPAVAPVSFELLYLLTAYGAQDFQIEILLGYAMEMLQENWLLDNERIQAILAAVAASEGGRVVLPALSALASSDVKEKITEIRLSVLTPDPDEMMRLWASLQTRYRPSILFKVNATLGGVE